MKFIFFKFFTNFLVSFDNLIFFTQLLYKIINTTKFKERLYENNNLFYIIKIDGVSETYIYTEKLINVCSSSFDIKTSIFDYDITLRLETCINNIPKTNYQNNYCSIYNKLHQL